MASETELLLMAARAGLLRYALRMVAAAAAAAAAAVYRLRAAWPLVRAGRLAMYRCRAARHRAVAVVALCLCLLAIALVLLAVLLWEVQQPCKAGAAVPQLSAAI